MKCINVLLKCGIINHLMNYGWGHFITFLMSVFIWGPMYQCTEMSSFFSWCFILWILSNMLHIVTVHILRQTDGSFPDIYGLGTVQNMRKLGYSWYKTACEEEPPWLDCVSEECILFVMFYFCMILSRPNQN